jgi:hypothetical protein
MPVDAEKVDFSLVKKKKKGIFVITMAFRN